MSGPDASQTGEERHSKRQRTAIACDSCRSRKTRCDGGRPSCGVCLDMEFDCKYTKRSGRNKVTPTAESVENRESVGDLKDRVDSMERLLRSLTNENLRKRSGCDEPVSGRSRGPQHVVPVPSTIDLVTSPLEDGVPADFDADNGLLEDTTHQEDTVDGMGSITFADEVPPVYFGPTSNSAFLSQVIKSFPGGSQENSPYQEVLSNASIDHVSRPSSPHPLSPRPIQSDSRPSSARDIYVLPPRRRIIGLVNAFFTRPGMLFPYIYRDWVLDELREEQSPNLHCVRRSWLCLLNTIMAFSASLGAGRNISARVCTTESDVFLQRALQLLPDLTRRLATLETLQALLLMTQCLQGTRRSSQMWYVLRLAVQAAYQVGVHVSKKSDNCSPLEREVRKRTWYMCFILDKTCSMTFGRPPTIPNSYVTQDLPLNVELETLDEKNDQESMLNSQGSLIRDSTAVIYIQSIKLYKLIGEIIENVYQNNIESDVQLCNSDILERIISIEKRLDAWKSSLPPNLCVTSKEEIMRNLNSSSVFSNLSTVITLRYLIARILLHRRTIVCFLNSQKEQPSESENPEFLRLFGMSSLEIGVLSASEMIGIIFNLSEHQHLMLTTWWFSIYYIFSASLLVFGVLTIEQRQGSPLLCSARFDLPGTLNKALMAMENIGDGTRISSRCIKYLTKLVRVAGISKPDSSLGQSLAGEPHQAELASLMPNPDLSDFLMMDFDAAGNLFTCGWDPILP